jgi:hypothetical protein
VDPYGEEVWDEMEYQKSFEQYSNSDIDPYNEENWEADDNFDDFNKFKEGDAVICINPINARVKRGLDYEVLDVGLDGRFMTLKGVNGWYRMKNFIEMPDDYYNIRENNDIDPYDEEDWGKDALDIKQDIKIGDTVICIDNANVKPGTAAPFLKMEYKVLDILKNGRLLHVELKHPKSMGNVIGKYMAYRFIKKENVDEHIHYLMDDYDEEDDEILELVGRPSGQYLTIKRSEYTDDIKRYVNWSENLKMYVFRDKDLVKILSFLDEKWK